MPSTNVTVIGIGNMGAALAKALLDAGFKLTIWNRSAQRPQVISLIQAGAEFEGDLQTAIRKSDGVLLVCVVDYDAMYTLLAPLDAEDSHTALAGRIVVNVTNGTPNQAREMSAWIKARGAACYFDGSVLRRK
ncbi:hypothetical protein NQ176_g7990 [Zarea fungicola]|uniref:Uncharacterized protein n=1 Tax=Zarea fungicola TaxID=93591 RepID=A0ACC1MWE5_9HYPO|nr:hypothetical protein NQ176_g7990 [Lecanicillium fungicola]